MNDEGLSANEINCQKELLTLLLVCRICFTQRAIID
jgi:hypothetical protein